MCDVSFCNFASGNAAAKGAGWGYYFKVGVVLTLPVVLVTLSALVVRLGL